MAGRAVCQVALALFLMLSLTTGAWTGCPGACRCSFAMLQCLEANGISSIPVLIQQESENVTEIKLFLLTLIGELWQDLQTREIK
ncbi:high affinity nerve growth factor receptor [Tachysurus ichikawai]